MVEYIEEITVCNEQIFNDKESHTITMRFYDGYAISTNNLYGMSYPTLFQVQNTDWMQKEITDYCGDGRDGTDYPFDIALKYGILFKLSQDSKLERKIKWLEQFAIVDVDRKAAYEKFCNELDAPNKEYFVLYHDRTGEYEEIEARLWGLAETDISHQLQKKKEEYYHSFIEPGAKVWWSDPAGESSDWFYVDSIEDDGYPWGDETEVWLKMNKNDKVATNQVLMQELSITNK